MSHLPIISRTRASSIRGRFPRNHGANTSKCGSDRPQKRSIPGTESAFTTETNFGTTIMTTTLSEAGYPRSSRSPTRERPRSMDSARITHRPTSPLLPRKPICVAWQECIRVHLLGMDLHLRVTLMMQEAWRLLQCMEVLDLCTWAHRATIRRRSIADIQLNEMHTTTRIISELNTLCQAATARRRGLSPPLDRARDSCRTTRRAVVMLRTGS